MINNKLINEYLQHIREYRYQKPTKQNIWKIILSYSKENVPRSKFDYKKLKPTTPIYNVFDKQDILEIIMKIEEALDVDIKDPKKTLFSRQFKLKTVNDLIKFVLDPKNSKPAPRY